jgi:hypothetical protein
MKTKIIFSLGLLLSLGSAACGSDTTGTDGGVADGGVEGPPAAPALGAQIDRMGRPAVNTALTDPFSTTTPATADANKDGYNTAAVSSSWGATYKGPFATSLAIFDSLDQNCGNQVAAGAMLMAGRYDTLAGLLADDQLYVRSDKTSCTQYLAVELGVAGVNLFNNDCGGRTLSYDVVDVTYSALASGSIGDVTDGVPNDSTFATTFPFLAAPQ